MITLYISDSLLASFVVLFDNGNFKAKFDSLQLSLKTFLGCVERAAVPAANLITETMEVRVSRR